MGIYEASTENNSEGKIILFKNCIEQYANGFYNNREAECLQLGINNAEECTELVYTIVLWHELGHWVTHWMKDSLDRRWDDSFWTLTPNPNNLLEGLAQLIADYAIEIEAEIVTKKKLQFMFEKMLIGQSEPYHKHKEIQGTENYSIEICFRALELLRDQFTNANGFDCLIKTPNKIEGNKQDIIEKLELTSILKPNENKYLYRVRRNNRIAVDAFVFEVFKFFVLMS